MNTVSRRVYYAGRVQGVGFRYTARQIAAGFAVAGFVRNLPSGEVELVAEGTAEQVEAFLAEVARRMAGYVTHTRVCEDTSAGHAGFSIRH
jgi:acylphosphatase